MDRQILNGFKFGFVLFLFFGFLSLVYSSTLHQPFEILSGTFEGNYSFSGNINFTNSTVIGLTLGESITSGTIITFALTDCPSGWLKANGSDVSRSTYGDLFSAINTTYGVGDGSTTFTLPDFRGEFIRGLDDGRGVDSGRTLNVFQEGTGVIPASDYSIYMRITNDDGTYSSRTHLKSTSYNGGSDTFSYERVRPRNMALLYCIKY